MMVRRVLAAGLLLAGASLTTASCSDLLVGEGTDAFATLCAELQSCYGEEAYDCAAIDARARSAALDRVGGFLDAYSPEACHVSCAEARICGDQAPFCAVTSAPCTRGDSCCGYVDGEALCSETNGCCVSPGARCTQDLECCDGEACQGGVCGGIECAAVDDSCRSALECCTKRCVDNVCRKKDCSPLGDPCQTTEECCADGGALVCGESGRCEIPGCTALPDGEQCDPAEPTCCASGVCQPGIEPSLPSFCGAGCFGFGGDCTNDFECCGPLFCDYSGVSPACSLGAPNCLKQSEACGSADDCCSGLCLDGECASIVIGCQTPACHPTCVDGAPLDPAALSCGPGNDLCSAKVAEIDDFCRCVTWDAICVGIAQLLTECAGCP